MEIKADIVKVRCELSSNLTTVAMAVCYVS
jgi:hypothetical protein